MRLQTKRGAKKVPWLLAGMLAVAGCSKSNAGGPSGTDEAQKKLDELGDTAIEKRDEIERALQAQLDAARKALDEIAAEAKTEGAEGREKVVEELRKDEQIARAKLDELRASSADTWKRLCTEARTESQRVADRAKELFRDG